MVRLIVLHSINYVMKRILTSRTLNGTVIERTEHYELSETENSYSLRVEEAALSDAGLFKLKLSNCLGEVAKSAPVTVHGE